MEAVAESTAVLDVGLGSRAYPIHIGPGLMQDSALWTQLVGGRNCLIVSNDVVADLYLEALQDTLPSRQPTCILPDGEAYKTIESYLSIVTALTEHKATRDWLILALGGGVIGDLSGFAAASYMRGINFIQIPTTLLAQVDASVGGKTGLNLPAGKNLLGAFHQPIAVITDTSSLRTLPEREYRAGIAEVLKIAFVWDASFISWMQSNAQALNRRDETVVQQAIKWSCQLKADIVAKDETERGVRALLNFGHTFGHAIESLAGYGEYLHGEAVAIGMHAALALSERLGYIDADQKGRAVDTLDMLNLPLRLTTELDAEALVQKMQLDKKNTQSSLRFIALQSLGSGTIIESNDIDMIRGCCEAIQPDARQSEATRRD